MAALATRDDRGFTTAELMFVVLILGILVAIAVVTFAASSERVERATCYANQRTLQGAVTQYQTDHNGSLPTTLTDLSPYVRIPGDFAECPSDATVKYTYDPVTGVVSCTLHP